MKFLPAEDAPADGGDLGKKIDISKSEMQGQQFILKSDNNQQHSSCLFNEFLGQAVPNRQCVGKFELAVY